MVVINLLDAKLHPLEITITKELIFELIDYFMPRSGEKSNMQREYLAAIKRKVVNSGGDGNDDNAPNRTRRLSGVFSTQNQGQMADGISPLQSFDLD